MHEGQLEIPPELHNNIAALNYRYEFYYNIVKVICYYYTDYSLLNFNYYYFKPKGLETSKNPV